MNIVISNEYLSQLINFCEMLLPMRIQNIDLQNCTDLCYAKYVCYDAQIGMLCARCANN